MTLALVAPPFGRDLSCTDQVRYGQLVSGFRLVAESLYRRFTTERGQLEDDPNFGLNLVGWLQSNDTTLGNMLALRSQIIAECLKDERVESADAFVSSTPLGVGSQLSVTISATLSDGTNFTMALNVNDVTVQLLDVQEAA